MDHCNATSVAWIIIKNPCYAFHVRYKDFSKLAYEWLAGNEWIIWQIILYNHWLSTTVLEIS